MKLTYRRSWARNLLMFSNLTLGHSFKVKQWFTGFGELSFRLMQICISSPMRRSSCNCPSLARDALVLGPSVALHGDPTPVTSVSDTPQTVPQECVSQEPSVLQLSHLLSRSGQLQEQGFSVEVAERIAAPERPSTRTIYQSKVGPV